MGDVWRGVGEKRDVGQIGGAVEGLDGTVCREEGILGRRKHGSGSGRTQSRTISDGSARAASKSALLDWGKRR